MQNISTTLNTLRRPQLLMRAARIRAQDYKRTSHLPRLLGYGQVPKHAAALIKLMEYEDDLNSLRRANDSSYNRVRHIDVLIAIVGEARLLRASRSQDT